LQKNLKTLTEKTTISDLFNCDSLITKAKKNKNITLAEIQFSISFLNDNLNINRKMSDQQIEVAANLILEEYYNLSMEDLNLCFKKALKGDYGQFYEGLDVMKILGWLRIYFNQRCDIAELESYNKHKLKKKESIADLEKSAILKYYEKLKKSKAIKKEIKHTNKREKEIRFITNLKYQLTKNNNIDLIANHYKKRVDFCNNEKYAELYNYYIGCYYYVKLISKDNEINMRNIR